MQEIQNLALTELGIAILVFFVLGVIGLVTKRWGMNYVIGFFGTVFTLLLVTVALLSDNWLVIELLYIAEILFIVFIKSTVG